MAEQLVSHSAGLTRFGRDARASADELGPLADLVGTWIGSRGWELMAVPTYEGGQEGFRLIVRPYVEVVTFVPIGAPVPDRGGKAGDLFLTGLKYEMRIADAETNEPLHLENGMWFYMPGQKKQIARSSAIPHGDCFLALGNASTSATPHIPHLNAYPDGKPPGSGDGYFDVYMRTGQPIDTKDMNATLRKTAHSLDVVQTTTLTVSTDPPGGILNIPFVTANANATWFEGTYWIETISDPATDQTYQQLQYSQNTSIEFLEKEGGTPREIIGGTDPELIRWPHVNVNTLRKQ